MMDLQHRARTLTRDEQASSLGERIVLAARMAVCEHLRQSFVEAHASDERGSQWPIVIGGADRAAGSAHQNVEAA